MLSKKKIKEIKELFILIVIAFTIKTCLIEIYVVPTGSMEKTILIGDMLFGNKFIYGMKTPDWIGIPYTRFGFYIPSFRFPKFRSIKNEDVTIFEFPRDPFQKYVKRCIGIPGDKILIDNGDIYINDKKISFPENGQYLKKLPDNTQILTKNISWQSDMMYSSFKCEPYEDINKNLTYEADENFYDINNNGKWDYGNIDNIQSFIIPYKSEEFNDTNGNNRYDLGEEYQDINDDGIWNKGFTFFIDKIYDWENFINLLILDDNDIILYDEDNDISWNLSIIDPKQISRLEGLVKYKILGIFQSKDMKSKRKLLHKQDQEQREYAAELIADNNKNNIINPWDERIIDKAKDGTYLKENLTITGKELMLFEEYTVKKDYYFFMGDNRDNSYDSRFWGYVPDDNILGIPVYAFINIADFKLRMRVVN